MLDMFLADVGFC